jgi:hypothetical protein
MRKIDRLSKRVKQLSTRHCESLLMLMIGGASCPGRTMSFVQLLDQMLPIAERWQNGQLHTKEENVPAIGNMNPEL